MTVVALMNQVDVLPRIVSVANRSGMGMDRLHVMFENGYGASIIRGELTCGAFEVAVLNTDGELDYSTPVTADVIPNLDEAGVMDVVVKIANL